MSLAELSDCSTHKANKFTSPIHLFLAILPQSASSHSFTSPSAYKNHNCSFFLTHSGRLASSEHIPGGSYIHESRQSGDLGYSVTCSRFRSSSIRIECSSKNRGVFALSSVKHWCLYSRVTHIWVEIFLPTGLTLLLALESLRRTKLVTISRGLIQK